MKSTEQDDDDWFEILAGRNPANADPATRLEAEALRSAVLKKVAEDLQVMPDRPMDFEQFMQQINDDLAKQPDLIQTTQKSIPNKKNKCWTWDDWWRPQWMPIGVMATLVLTISLMYWLLPKQQIEQANILGSGDFVVQSVDPLAKAKEIANECKTAEINCDISPINDKNSVTVTITLPEKPNPQTVDFLRRYQIVLSDEKAPIKLEIRPIKGN